MENEEPAQEKDLAICTYGRLRCSRKGQEGDGTAEIRAIIVVVAVGGGARPSAAVLLLLERWSLLRPLDQSHSTIFRFGGVGCTERTGAIPKAPRAL
jgi:hypothetical protein